MAKAIFNKLSKEQGLPFRAESAGTEPGEHIHPNVLEAMKEMGIDLSHESPKRLTNDMVYDARRVITMGCTVDAEACPAVFLKGVEDWGLPDPKGKSLEEVGAIRDTIRQRVEVLVKSMEPQGRQLVHEFSKPNST